MGYERVIWDNIFWNWWFSFFLLLAQCVKQELYEENRLMYCVRVDEEIVECVENREQRSFDHINLYISKGSGSGSASGKVILSDMSVKSL